MISTSRNRRLYVAEALVMSVLRGLAERVLHQIFGKKLVDVDQILAWHRCMDEGQLGAGEEYRARLQARDDLGEATTYVVAVAAEQLDLVNERVESGRIRRERKSVG